ncbi:helix-turn-helix transcriptional regulator [Hymenobacter taeanensis]|uniref:Helix-turn-helix transcriptional regulator n=1 Tax=Hymenobacter taeanensis TaxID=2735321 RepID=A0A6M6BNK5_9BACT|nr:MULTISPECIES: helix-turn-helix transcriptional regulator [Hymenobacter]QJX49073.1 helix-turn-helix transcriptional regulator [Hymenobacter taeanensis]UOQ81406.1 helix-turn-helix transcriptional regulator [Hymenobacter sp. 5414T-23]
MTAPAPVHIFTIADYHRRLGLPPPAHPLVSVVRFEDMPFPQTGVPQAVVHHFYSLALKKSFHARLKYGQQEVDFNEGLLLCMAPRQLLAIEGPSETAASHRGWLLLVHPDLLQQTPLAKKIRQYEYFDYRVSEALHVSDLEEHLLIGLLKQLNHEACAPPDRLSRDVMVAQLELLFTYAERFYQRQFHTRRTANHQLLGRLEELLKAYFTDPQLSDKGLPPVTYLAEALHLSPNYLSRLLRTLTGQSTKQFILAKVVEAAKEQLSTTTLTVNEIAYSLGFAHPQAFSKLFKSQTQVSPTQFRQSFLS